MRRSLRTTTNTTTTKGNNGRAARRRLYQRLTALFSFWATLAFLCVSYQRSGNEHSLSSSSRTNRQLAASSSSSWLRRSSSQHHKANDNHGGDDDSGDDGDDEEETTTTHSMRDDQVLAAILDGRLSLVDVQPSRGGGAAGGLPPLQDDENTYDYVGYWTGHFCSLDWTAHKADPASSPMFRDVVQHSSSNCAPHLQHTLDLATVVAAARRYDQAALPHPPPHDTDDDGDDETDDDRGNNYNDRNTHMNHAHSKVRLLDVGGVVFHQSRCGSTLVANLLQAMEPAAHRVYSESAPPINVARLAASFLPQEEGDNHHHQHQHPNQLSPQQQGVVHTLRDVLYLMRRSADPAERRVFFKIQSIGSTYLPVFLAALPESTPWIFVYRQPAEVLVSQLAHGVRSANCVRAQTGRTGPTAAVRRVLADRGLAADAVHESLSPEAVCAAHLAAICETARDALTTSSSTRGRAVNYAQLPDRLYDDIFPHAWGLSVTDEALERMRAVAGVYSKGRGAQQGQAFAADASAKEAQVTPAVADAAHLFLDESYGSLQAMAYASS